ncbi:MAG: hypothetical protein E7374_01125 [Clostridiales bacterium]|nr:hypothetical protein [Clostridiales bacterium]
MFVFRIKDYMKLCDAHNDLLTSDKTLEEKIKIVKSWKSHTVILAIFTTKKITTFSDFLVYYKEFLTLKKVNENLMFSVEDIGNFSLEEVKKIITLKPFSLTLTWNAENNYAGGANSLVGLKENGKKIVEFAESKGVLIDTAHMSRKSYFDFIKITKFPIFNSHSNIFDIKKENRNLTHQQILEIEKSGGFLGLTIYEKFISNKKITSKDVAFQFKYLKDNYPSLYFGFGTDFLGIDENCLPQDVSDYNSLKHVKREMKNLGIKRREIKSIICKNFMKFRTRLVFTMFKKNH